MASAKGRKPMDTRRLEDQNQTIISKGYLIPLTKGCDQIVEITDFTTLGRDAGNTVKLNDPTVSGRHGRIERKAQGYIVRDLGSRNGTYLNGMRVTEANLTPNDKVRFGESVFVFSETGSRPSTLKSRQPAWNEQLQRLPAFAQTDFAVLITGPSGSGKEILARAIHEQSARAKGPFISINCSALSEGLIESELFGHTKGSFTGATHDRKGAFEAARGGTLFLDEIGDLPIMLQPKLLRALENKEIRPVGSDKIIETDVRIVAATHKNLPQQVNEKKFREDLYFRLNICQIRPPALHDRMEDFEDLIYSFAKILRVRFSFGAVEKLKEHSWPGNIRELKNTVARAAAYMPGEHIQPEHVEKLLDPVSLTQTSHFSSQAAPAGGSLIKEIEREMIIQRLIANKGNQRRTAADLGVPKSTLHDRIRTYSIDIGTLLSTYTT
jgi:DNA-binding NtrC family response regulator